MKLKSENLNHEQERQTIMNRIDVATKHLQTLEEHKRSLLKRIEKYKKVLNHSVAKKYVAEVKGLYSGSTISRLTKDLEENIDDDIEIKKAS